MFEWADEMIKNMKENGEIKEKEGEENVVKLNDDDLKSIANIVISQLNSEPQNENESENESED